MDGVTAPRGFGSGAFGVWGRMSAGPRPTCPRPIQIRTDADLNGSDTNLYGAREAIVQPAAVRSQTTAGMTTTSRTVRSTTRGSEIRPPPSAITRRPSSRLPGVKPTVPTVSTLSTAKTTSAQLLATCALPPLSRPYAMSRHSAQSMKSAAKRRPGRAIEPGPSSGSPSCCPRYPNSTPMSSAAARGPEIHDPIACLLSTRQRYCDRIRSLRGGPDSARRA